MTIKEQIESLKKYKDYLLSCIEKQIETLIDEDTEKRFAPIGESKTKSKVKVLKLR